jgi:hypothetical protein
VSEKLAIIVVFILIFQHISEELQAFGIVLVLLKKLLDLGCAVIARLYVSGVRFRVIWFVVRDN